MKVILLKLEKGFLENLGDSKDYEAEVEHFMFDRWCEDRESEERFKKHFTIMPMVNFEQLIQLPLAKLDSGSTTKDRYPTVTSTLLNLYTVGASHAECTHVIFVKNWG